VKLGLIVLVAPFALVIAVIALTWAIAMPLLLYFLGSDRRDREAHPLAGS
jgi:Tfp pilus assembly protein FimT